MSDVKTFIQNTGLTLTLQPLKSEDVNFPYCANCVLSLEGRIYEYQLGAKKPIKETIKNALCSLSDDVLDYYSYETNEDIGEEEHAADKEVYEAIVVFFGEHFDDFWALGLNN